MSQSKTHVVVSKVKFTGKRALNNVPGQKDFKGKDVRFFEGVSEPLTKSEAQALAKAYRYKAVKNTEDAEPTGDENGGGESEERPAKTAKNDELKSWLEDHGVEIDGNETKDDLNAKIDAYLAENE